MRKSVSYNALVQPVCPPTLDNLDGICATVVGYGRTENISKLSVVGLVASHLIMLRLCVRKTMLRIKFPRS